jgi:UDP-N-acetylglucosamine--N-acetylmuramyl-(pentapeptide) pyrophosphoryl-undecaprenol N-acetylglucosamine transferase
MIYAFAAAGTGGHIYPALAVARELVASGIDRDDILFFGGDRLETTAVPDAGFELVQLDVRGLKRSMTVDNLTIPAMVRRAASDVETALTGRTPGVLTVFGGYVSVPAALGARRVGMPYVIHEQNAVPGLANRYVARRAARTLVAFAPALKKLRGAQVVGNPLDEAFSAYDEATLRPAALARYGLDPDVPVVGIVGGSLGAQALNEAAIVLADLPDRAFQILHLTGTVHHEAISTVAAGSDRWVTAAFESRMQDFYAASDVVLSRAGAMTISELSVTATPAVVVPLPAGKGYQAFNASDLQQAGGAIVVDQTRIDTVPAIVADLVADPERRETMRTGARYAARPDATRDVARIVMEVAGA